MSKKNPIIYLEDSSMSHKILWTMSLYDEEKRRVGRHGKRLFAEIKEDDGKVEVSIITAYKKPDNGANVTYIGFYDKRARDMFLTRNQSFSTTEDVVKTVCTCNRTFAPPRKVTSSNPKVR
jgi:hypothetical protein